MEQNTDDILNNPEKRDKNKNKSQDDVEETVSKCKYRIHSIVSHLYYIIMIRL